MRRENQIVASKFQLWKGPFRLEALRHSTCEVSMRCNLMDVHLIITLSNGRDSARFGGLDCLGVMPAVAFLLLSSENERSIMEVSFLQNIASVLDFVFKCCP